MAIDWAAALQGLGAGLQGRLPEHRLAKVREQQLQQGEQERQRVDMAHAARQTRMMLESGQTGQAQNFLMGAMNDIQQRGGDVTSHADVYRMISEGRIDDALNDARRAEQMAVGRGYLKPLPGPQMKIVDGQVVSLNPDGTASASPITGFESSQAQGMASAKTTHFKNGSTLMSLPDGTTKVTDPSGNVVTGERRQQVLSEALDSEVRIAGARAEATATGKAKGAGSTERAQLAIDEGIDAAKGAAVVRRGLELLQEVKTGGFNAVALRAKQLFGVESGDEAELSANLGKAVLSQLRATFGAQFTEKEGDRLAKIEAGFGKSTEGNRRLLNQTMQLIERAAKRGIKAAATMEDYRAAAEIQELLDFRLSDEDLTERFTAAPEAEAGADWQPFDMQGIKFLGFE